MNATVYRDHPGRGHDRRGVRPRGRASPAPPTSAGSGFGFKWNMGWMHDTLDYIGRDPVYRGYHHNQMTFSLMYAFSENFVLPISHDEVVHGKGSLWTRMPGDDWNKAAGHPRAAGLHVGAPGQAAAVHGRRVRPGAGVVGVPLAGLAPARGPAARRHQGAGRRPQPGLPRASPALWTKDTTPEGFSWIDANDAGGQRAELPAPRRRRRRQADRAGLHRELRRHARTRTTAWACRSPGAGARCSTPTPRLRRVRGRQPRRRRGRADDVARPAGVGGAAAAAVRGAVAGAGAVRRRGRRSARPPRPAPSMRQGPLGRRPGAVLRPRRRRRRQPARARRRAPPDGRVSPPRASTARPTRRRRAGRRGRAPAGTEPSTPARPRRRARGRRESSSTQ